MGDFKKRIFIFRSYLSSQFKVLKDLPALISAKRAGRVSKEFEERLMLAVSAVNGCKYCVWFHTKLSLKHGLAQSEISSLLNKDIGDMSTSHEAVGILFAQHYAETGCNPDKEVTEKLYHTYGTETADDIMVFLQLITYGNLMGNTFSAFLSRLKGSKAPDSFVLSELLIFLIGLPLFAPMMPFMKK